MNPTIPTEWSEAELAGFLRDLEYQHEDGSYGYVAWTRPVRSFLGDAETVSAFHLVRERGGPRGTCPRAFVERGGVRTPLPHVIQHHDRRGLGWDWAHSGTRSADLALNLLATLVGPREAWRMHYPFMREFLRGAHPEAATLDGADVRRWIQAFWDGETPRQLRCEEREQAAIEMETLPRDAKYLSIQTRAEMAVRAMRRDDGDCQQSRSQKERAINFLTENYKNRWVMRRVMEIIDATPGFKYATYARAVDAFTRHMLTRWDLPEPPLEEPPVPIGTRDLHTFDPSLDATSSLDDPGLLSNLVVPSREFVAAWHERRWRMRMLPKREDFVPLYPDALMRLASRVYDSGEWDALFHDVFDTPELTAAWLKENGIPEDVPISALTHALNAEFQNRYPTKAEDDIRGAHHVYERADPYLSFDARERWDENEMRAASGMYSERERLQDRHRRREQREMERESQRWGSARPSPEEEEKNDFHYDLGASYEAAYAAAYGPHEKEPPLPDEIPDPRYAEADAALALIFPDTPTPDTPEQTEEPS